MTAIEVGFQSKLELENIRQSLASLGHLPKEDDDELKPVPWWVSAALIVVGVGCIWFVIFAAIWGTKQLWGLI